jgi:hypothetical protein
MNLKTSDRASAGFVALSLLTFPFVFFQPLLIILLLAFLFAVFFLNLKIFRFFASKKGFFFALLTYPWLFFYFFYSGAAFVFCWFRYALPSVFSIKEKKLKSTAGEFESKEMGA